MNSEQPFLGSGWSFPPTFGRGGGEVQLVSGALDIQQSLQLLFSTMPGERLMAESYGCDLNTLLFAEIGTTLMNRIHVLISDAILYHEPRIRLDHLEIQESESERGLLWISLFYTIRNTNSRYNMVYPFYIQEATFRQEAGERGT
jgi:phage baseplate assembly protein W